jgi:hypothetical protein
VTTRASIVAHSNKENLSNVYRGHTKKAKAIRISSYHSTFDPASMTRELAVPIYLIYGSSTGKVNLTSAMYLMLLPTKQHGIRDASGLLQIVWKPKETHPTSESHVVKEAKFLSNKHCLLPLQGQAINRSTCTS